MSEWHQSDKARMPDPLERVLKGDLCSGCGLCAAITDGQKIEMGLTKVGYLRPRSNRALSQDQAKTFSEVCPGLSLEHTPDVPKYHSLWGPIVSVHTGQAADSELRYTASSGGGLSALLTYLLDNGKIDYVVQTKASPKLVIGNVTVLSRSVDEIRSAAGSRYAPSAPLTNIASHLDAPGLFAFVGKACDVAALRALGRRDERVAEKVVCLISFFCAGVPSLTGARMILERMGVAEDEVAAFKFRGDGWPGYATATLHNGQKHQISYKESWGVILSKHQQFRCKICPDGTGEFADVVFADAWYPSNDDYPSFEEADGRSLIIGRTELGRGLLESAVSSGCLETEPCHVDEIERMQPAQARRKKLVLSRLAALRLLGRVVPQFRRLGLHEAARLTSLFANAKSMLGLIRRLIGKRV
ncbi:MAG: Coenzyme F420 hydrogenase/dehydrogenase, beta subunit C-terminal domain [Pseudomonadota bacterium]